MQKGPAVYWENQRSGAERDGELARNAPAISPAASSHAITPSRNAMWGYLRENGWLLLTQKVCEVAQRRTRDRILAHQLRTSELRLGSKPKLRGLRHMRIGCAFSAGDQLWLEAVTSFNGISFEPLLTIGQRVNFSDQVHVACIDRVMIGDGVLCGSKVLITDHSHGCYLGPNQSNPDERPSWRRLFSQQQVTIGDNVWLGDGVAVLAGAEIGFGSVIGANSVVKGVIPPLCIAVGAPARPVRQWDPELQQWKKC